MDTDDAMGLATDAAQRKKVNTDRVKDYLRIVAYELIEDDNSDEKYAIWTTMTRAEKDTANDLVEAMFSEWL